MKTILSAWAAVLVLVAASGCHLTGHCPCASCDGEYSDMGCSKPYWGDWNTDPDPCDSCGNFSGCGAHAHAVGSGGGTYADVATYKQPAAWQDEPHVEPQVDPGYRLVPGSVRVRTHSGQPAAAGRPTLAARPQ